MFDHPGLRVSDLARARAFYDRALAPLGITLRVEVSEETTGGQGAHLGYGRDLPGAGPQFWIGTGAPAATAVHVAFAALDRAAVAGFHAAALAAGGRDNGAPGLRPQYTPDYYGAFVLDPDGNNVEAVCRGPA